MGGERVAAVARSVDAEHPQSRRGRAASRWPRRPPARRRRRRPSWRFMTPADERRRVSRTSSIRWSTTSAASCRTPSRKRRVAPRLPRASRRPSGRSRRCARVLPDLAARVEHREVQPGISATVAGRPDHRADAGPCPDVTGAAGRGIRRRGCRPDRRIDLRDPGRSRRRNHRCAAQQPVELGIRGPAW